jgi:transaldolase/fructose-6-phosphate aldolase-like protein/fumarylacetoacetase-like protein
MHFFIRPPKTTLVGPGEMVRIPRSTKQFDWECELAIVGRPNVFIKISGTAEGLPAIEEAIFAGVPINVTPLFSPEQYVAAAEAYLRGIERRNSSRRSRSTPYRKARLRPSPITASSVRS